MCARPAPSWHLWHSAGGVGGQLLLPVLGNSSCRQLSSDTNLSGGVSKPQIPGRDTGSGQLTVVGDIRVGHYSVPAGQ